MKLKDIIVIALLILISGILIHTEYLKKTEKPALGKWEYRIEGVKDYEWDETMKKIGNDGWEVSSCRRAQTDNDYNSDDYLLYGEDMMLYECILKRPRK